MNDFYAYIGNGEEVDPDAAWSYVREGYLLAPRTVLKGRVKSPRSPLPDIAVEPGRIPSVVRNTLEASLGRMTGSRAAVMFSGGFDSMLIACLAQRCGADVTAVTVQFDEFNPATVAEAVRIAKLAGFRHHVLAVKAAEFLSAFEKLAGITNEPVLDLDLAVVYAALKRYDPRTAGTTFISGMGSDQWFGNMALEDWPGGGAGRLDWAMIDVAAHQRAADAHGCRFVFPFLSGPMLALSQKIPAELKKDKKLLRALAIANEIPSRGARSEVQVPPLMRQAVIRTYGERAWPSPVPKDSQGEQVLRQIALGIWLERMKAGIAGR